MKIYHYLLLAIFLPIIAVGQDFYYPIDIVYQPSTETYYVSNWADGNGYILKLDKEGNITETFYDGLHYAGGLCIVGDKLYVLDNLDLNISGSSLPSHLIGIDLATGNEVSNVEISTGGTYLNFVEHAYNNLYISDEQKLKIYSYNLQDNTVSDFISGLTTPPFGICFDTYNDRLLFTQNGTNKSFLKSVHPLGGTTTHVYTIDSLYIKGIIQHPDSNFYYTTWFWGGQWGDEEVRKVNYEFIWDYVPSNNHDQPFGLCIGFDDVVAICNWGDHTLSFLEDEVFSVEEFDSKPDPYTVYPNPTNGKFRIGFSENVTSNIEIVILNMTGQQVYHEKVNNSSILTDREFDMQHLPAGTYVVILKDDSSVSQKKLIIN